MVKPMYADNFSLAELQQCTTGDDCLESAPYAVDGCNWVLAGEKSGYYCTGIKGCTVGAAGDAACQKYGAGRGLAGTVGCAATAGVKNLPAGYTGPAVCAATDSPVQTLDKVWAAEGGTGSGPALALGCYSVTTNPRDPSELKLVSAGDCAATDTIWGGNKGNPNYGGDDEFTVNGKFVFDNLIATADSPLITAAPGTKFACLAPPVTSGFGPSIACLADDQGCLSSQSTPVGDCPAGTGVPAIGSALAPNNNNPKAGDHIWFLQLL